MSEVKYRPEIDGLRAIAVIPVILFHLGFGWINGGYLGVDVFFVISGFLISTIIFKENFSNKFSFKNFWLRRVRRILPALLFMTIVVLIASFYITFKPELREIANDAFSAMFSYANISMWFKFGDYWGSSAENSLFLHCWSLSVEEQFYLIYPPIIYFFFKQKTPLIKALSVLLLLSFLAFCFTAIYYPTASFYLLPTRAWELAAGGLLALVRIKSPLPTKSHITKALPVIGFIIIMGSFFYPDVNTGISLMVILPVIGSVLVIGFSSGADIIGKILSTKLMVFIGKISYSLYLWHWPIIVLYRQIVNNRTFNVSDLLILLLLISTFSLIGYFLVEKPMRTSNSIFKVVIVFFAIAISINLFYKYKSDDFVYPSGFNTLSFYGLYYDITPNIASVSRVNMQKRKGIMAPARDSLFNESYSQEGILLGKGNDKPQLLVIGDSHGAMWGKVIDEIGEELHIKRSFFTIVGNSPFFEIPPEESIKSISGFTNQQYYQYKQSMLKNILNWKPLLIIISCKWNTISDDDYLKLVSLITLAGEHQSKIIILNQPPMIDQVGNNNSTQYFSYLGFQPNGKDQYIELKDNSTVMEANNKLENLSKRFANVSVVDISSAFLRNNEALIIKDKDILYYDDDHLSNAGTHLLKDTLKQKIILDLGKLNGENLKKPIGTPPAPWEWKD